MSIPVSSLGPQVFVHLPGMSSQAHDPCQDMHICGVCKLSFTNVENFLTHKNIVCGKEIVQPSYPPDITITSSSATQEGTSTPTASLQTILQHPTTFLTPALSSTGGSLINSTGEVPLGGQILRVLLDNNEILFERPVETQGTTIGDLLPDETLQLLPDLPPRKNLNEKKILNETCSDKVVAEKVKDKGELPLEQAVVIPEDDRSVKKECQSMDRRRDGQIFQHDEENVVSLLANQLATTNSAVRQGGAYPVSVISVQSVSEDTNPSRISIATSTTSSTPQGNLESKTKSGITVRKKKGKALEEENSSKSNFESSALDKMQQSSKEVKQDQSVEVCLMTDGTAEERDETSSPRKKMPGLFKQRKIHMCAVEACDFSTTFTKDLIRHMRKHTGERPFKCEKCSRWFSRGDKLRTHLRIHAGLKPHACTLCPYKAVDSGSLRKHMRVHTDERPYKCQICPYSARDSSQLTVHLRTHTGDHPFICSYESCNASFKTSSDLKRHFRIHTGEKPFQCQLCQYKCSISSNLKAHMRQNHSENKSLNCSICSFSAPSKHALKEHEKSHCQPTSEGDALKCNTCGFSCFDMEAMTQHLKSNPHCEYASSESTTKSKEASGSTQQKPFRCSDCDFTCMLRGNLKNHIQRKHCIVEGGIGNNTKKKGRGVAKDTSRSRRGRGGKRGNMTGEGPPFCLRSHHCPLCNVSFVREDSWRSHIRQHQTKGEGLEIPLGPMMPSLVDSSETAIISTIEETPSSESPGNSLISLQEEGQSEKLIGGRPFIITFEGNEKSQEDQGNSQGGTGIINGFEETSGENHSVLLYVQADQDANQNQEDDENLRNGAEILASLNQSIPMNSSSSNSTKPIAIAPAPSSSQQHTILLATPQPSAHVLKSHFVNGNANTCQYIALPHEQIMHQLTATLQPGLQYMISGPLEAIMALPTALEQRQMTVASEHQRIFFNNPVISLQLNSVKEGTEMKDD